MPYHLAILHRPVLDGRNGERGKGEAGLEANLGKYKVFFAGVEDRDKES